MIEYIENDDTRRLSELCKSGGCENCLVQIWLDTLCFNNPDKPGDFLHYVFFDGNWHIATRTLNPWNGKILAGLQKYYPNGIDGMMPHMTLEQKIKLTRADKMHKNE